MTFASIIVVLAVLAIVITFAILGRSKSTSAVALSAQSLRTSGSSSVQSRDHRIWVEVLSEDKPSVHEFDLMGTPATVLWKDGDPEVSVVCITQFQRGSPKTKKYDHYEYNLNDKSWVSLVPKGSADTIKRKFEELFASRSVA